MVKALSVLIDNHVVKPSRIFFAASRPAKHLATLFDDMKGLLWLQSEAFSTCFVGPQQPRHRTVRGNKWWMLDATPAKFSSWGDRPDAGRPVLPPLLPGALQQGAALHQCDGTVWFVESFCDPSLVSPGLAVPACVKSAAYQATRSQKSAKGQWPPKEGCLF